MRAHKAFFVWVSTLLPPEASPQGIAFAKAELHGGHDAAVTDGWLKNRQGKTLRTKWGLLAKEERAERLLAVQDDSFSLEDNSTGILDDRRDASCYPKRTGSVDMSTVVQHAAPATPPSIARPPPIDRAFSQFAKLHRELTDAAIKAALTAELTAMAMAVRENDAHGVALRAAAVIDCLGEVVVGAAHDDYRDTVLGIAQDVSKYVSATRLQLHEGLHTDQEAKDAVHSATSAVSEAKAALREFVATAEKSNLRYKSAYQDRKPARATQTRFLQDISWIDNSAAFVQMSEADESVPCSEPNGVHRDDASETTTHSADEDGGVAESIQRTIAENAKKTPRECVRKKARHRYYFG
ncbi:hypothetical protein PF010_g24286 [Phytophthora fragariae]|uniref:Uncharacterized protein n=2 Tax=Phytophthora fragariae TaxID=53985 RepID=A0A6G0K3W8_9STRA|nr:hypothetical protein PF010_g24286 [Phytophthora fragariae]